MKFYCDNCNAKYSIADEKVRGKILKVRCKACSNIITVREPKAPIAQSNTAPPRTGGAPPPPPKPSLIAWYYAINGQSFGPFDSAQLQSMFESGELGDACYLWNEKMSGWLPAREVPVFTASLEKGDMLRPRNNTIGVSSALEAVKVDAVAQNLDERDEQEGFVPGQQPTSEQSERLDGLRDKLKQHQAPEVGANPFEDSTTQMSVSEISGLLDKNGPLGQQLAQQAPAPEDARAVASDPVEEEPAPSFDAPPAAAGLSGSDLFSDNQEEEELLPSFGSVESGGESVIDFSRLEANRDESNPFAEASFDTGGASGDGEEFQASNSLLIQMDSIQKQGRGKRFMLIGAAAVLFVSVGVIGAISATGSRFQQPEEATQYDGQKKDLVLKTYKEDERALFFDLDEGEEIITAEDAKATFDAMEKEELAVKNGAATKPKTTPRNNVIAKNTQPKVKPSIDDEPRGIGGDFGSLLKKDGGGLDDALGSSKTGKGGNTGGLGTKGDKVGGTAPIGKAPEVRGVKRTGPSLQPLGSASSSKGGIYKGGDPRDGSKGSEPSGFGKTKLDQKDAKKGFKKVSRSVAFCHQKQVTRGLPLDSAKVHLTVEIQGTGEVTGLKIEPASLRSTEFANCLQSHRRLGRWSFVAYGGKTVKIRHTYVLQ